jgi:hypothetical protein
MACTIVKFCFKAISMSKLTALVNPMTGNDPPIMPIVMDNASFSEERPSLGIILKGIRTLCFTLLSIFKVIVLLHE